MMNKGVVYALWAYEAQNSDELSFHEGDALSVLRRKDESETDWWWARLGDREGYVPKTLLGVSTPRCPWGPVRSQLSPPPAVGVAWAPVLRAGDCLSPSLVGAMEGHLLSRRPMGRPEPPNRGCSQHALLMGPVTGWGAGRLQAAALRCTDASSSDPWQGRAFALMLRARWGWHMAFMTQSLDTVGLPGTFRGLADSVSVECPERKRKGVFWELGSSPYEGDEPNFGLKELVCGLLRAAWPLDGVPVQWVVPLS